MAGHGDIAYIEGYDALMFFYSLVDIHHPVPGQVEGIMAAHQAAAAGHFELGQMEAVFLHEAFDGFLIICHKGIDRAGRAEGVRIFLQQQLVVLVLETVHGAAHQDCLVYAVGLHAFLQGVFRGKGHVSQLHREQLEDLTVAPLGPAAADGAGFASSAITCYRIGEVQVRINFFHLSSSVLKPFWHWPVCVSPASPGTPDHAAGRRNRRPR